MTCANCSDAANFIDNRPGAEPVGFCHAHLPAELQGIADQLVVKPAPQAVTEDGPQPTEVGAPVPVETNTPPAPELTAVANVLAAALGQAEEKPKKRARKK